MLRLLGRQLTVLVESERRSLAVALLAEMEALDHQRIRPWTVDEVLRVMDQARQFGFDTRRHVFCFLLVSREFGSFFWERRPDVRGKLADPELTKQSKAEYLMDLVDSAERERFDGRSPEEGAREGHK